MNKRFRTVTRRLPAPDVAELSEDQRRMLREKMRDLGETLRSETAIGLTQPDVRQIVRSTATDLYKSPNRRR